jgi:hypothetical protein
MDVLENAFRRIVDFISFVFLAHVSLPRAINQHNLRNWEPNGSVTLYQYNPTLYTWPLITVGFYSLVCDHLGLVSPNLLGWAWTITLVLVLLTLAIDVGRLGVFMTIIMTVLFLCLFRLIEVELNVPLRQYLMDAFGLVEMTFPKGMVLIVTITFGFVYASMFIWKRMDSVLTIQGDQVTVHRFAADAISFAPGSWAFHAHLTDILEWLIGGGSGTLAIIHPISKKELFVARHVPGFAAIAQETRRRLSVMVIETPKDEPLTPSSVGIM